MIPNEYIYTGEILFTARKTYFNNNSAQNISFSEGSQALFAPLATANWKGTNGQKIRRI